MKKSLLIISLLLAVNADFLNSFRIFETANTPCDDSTQFFYMGLCMPKSCITDKMARMRLTPLDQLYNDPTILGITYHVVPMKNDTSNYYRVSIMFNDQERDQILSDPVNCIDWTVYQTANSADIDSTRLNVLGNVDGVRPTWPMSSYQFLTDQSVAQIEFDVLQQDLDAHQCIKFIGGGQYTWKCYFELAFIVQKVTQVSYYMGITITVSTSVSNAVPIVDFVKISQVNKCSSDSCTVQRQIGSQLNFCSDKNCTNLSQNPFYVLFVNRAFWMKQQILDTDFYNWYINDITVTYQSSLLTLKLQSGEFSILQHQPGFNILELKVPIVSNSVLITTQGQVSQTPISSGSRFLQSSSSNNTQNLISFASRSAGEIKSDLNTSSNAILPIFTVSLLLSVLFY